jgi:hypothetical protein
MNWNTFVDNYCERLLPGFWDEPLNAISNLAFWLAAWLVWRRWQRMAFTNLQLDSAPRSGDIKSLLVMLLLIGAGSFAFHTLATRWAGALDVLFIALYLHFYLAVYMHRALGLRWRIAWLGVPLFLVASWALSMLWRQVPGAGAGYLSAWTILLLLCAHSAVLKLPSTQALAAAAACFAVSLSLRQLDMPLCSDWRWGTHFAWHLLNAVTLGFTSWAVVKLHLARRAAD